YYQRIVVAPEGGAWALRSQPRQVERYSHGNQLIWSSADVSPLAWHFADLAVDSNGNAYLVGDAGQALEHFGVAKFNSAGEVEWVSYHDDPNVQELALSVAALPTGGIVVAGVTNYDGENTETEGLLSWFGPDGTLMQDFVFDGAANNDGDGLQSVAVGPDGNAVAVGYHQPGADDFRLWIIKVAI